MEKGSTSRGVCIQGGWADHPRDTIGYGQRAGGPHPTGMHSCHEVVVFQKQKIVFV